VVEVLELHVLAKQLLLIFIVYADKTEVNYLKGDTLKFDTMFLAKLFRLAIRYHTDISLKNKQS